MDSADPRPPLPADRPALKPAKSKSNWKLSVGLTVGGLLVLTLLIVAVIFLVRNPQLTASLRDVAIIAFAVLGLLMSIVLGGLLIVLVYYLQSLISVLRDEIKPVLTNVNQTVATVRGTTSMVSDNVTKPIIKLAGFFAGVDRARKVFTANAKGRSRRAADAGGGSEQETNTADGEDTLE